jgi:hypothetical protein
VVTLGQISSKKSVVSLDLLSPRSVIQVSLDLCSARSYDSELEVSETNFDEHEADGEMSNNEFADVLEFGPCRSVAQQTQGCNTDHSEEETNKRVRVRALPFRRAGFVPPDMSIDERMIYNYRNRAKNRRRGRPNMKIKFDQHRECTGCTHADDIDPESDEPPELDWTPRNSDDEGPPGLHPSSDEHSSDVQHSSDSEDESHGEREGSAPLERKSQNTTAQNSSREILLPTCVETNAIQVMEEIRLQSQSTSDNSSVIHPHGSIDESRVSTDDGSRGGGYRPRSQRHPPHSETQVLTVVDHDQRRQGSAIGGLCTLLPVRRPGISAMRSPDEWTELEVTVDSGACISVMPIASCEGIDILENELSRSGAEYEVANGATIPNLGERRCEVMTVGSLQPKRITFQVADVHKPLLSISGCADMGFDCFLGQHGGQLRDRVTGELIPLERHGSLYTVRMWIRQDPSARPKPRFGGPE